MSFMLANDKVEVGILVERDKTSDVSELQEGGCSQGSAADWSAAEFTDIDWSVDEDDEENERSETTVVAEVISVIVVVIGLTSEKEVSVVGRGSTGGT